MSLLLNFPRNEWRTSSYVICKLDGLVVLWRGFPWLAVPRNEEERLFPDEGSGDKGQARITLDATKVGNEKMNHDPEINAGK
jgi:hypothetical protein